MFYIMILLNLLTLKIVWLLEEVKPGKGPDIALLGVGVFFLIMRIYHRSKKQ